MDRRCHSTVDWNKGIVGMGNNANGQPNGFKRRKYGRKLSGEKNAIQKEYQNNEYAFNRLINNIRSLEQEGDGLGLEGRSYSVMDVNQTNKAQH